MTIGYHLSQIDRKFRRHIDLALHDKAGITGQQAWILSSVSHGLSSQRDLEKELCLRRSTISGIIDTMEREALVKRMPSPLDKRTKALVLTSKGTHVSALCEKTLKELDGHIQSFLGPEHTAQLHHILGMMEQALEAIHV